MVKTRHSGCPGGVHVFQRAYWTEAAGTGLTETVPHFGF